MLSVDRGEETRRVKNLHLALRRTEHLAVGVLTARPCSSVCRWPRRRCNYERRSVSIPASASVLSTNSEGKHPASQGRELGDSPSPSLSPHTQQWILISCCPHSQLQGRRQEWWLWGWWGGVPLVMSDPSDVFMSLAESSVSPAELRQREAEAAPPGLMDGWKSSPSAAPTSFIWQGRTGPTDPAIISQTSSDPVGEPPESLTSIHAKRQIRNCLCNV